MAGKDKESEIFEAAFKEVSSAPTMNKQDDAGLDDLLNDALNDFDALPRSGRASLEEPRASTSSSTEVAFDPLRKGKPKTSEKAFNPLPAQRGRKNAARKAGSGAASSSNEKSSPDEFAAGLDRLMKELSVAEGDAANSGETGGRSRKEVSETLKALSEEAARLRSDSSATEQSADDIFSEPMFAGLQDQLLRGEGQEAGMSQLADTLMRQLLSKDVLYQPMKDIGDRYPAWLEKQKATMPAQDFRQYEQQYAHIQEIVSIYEHDSNNYDRLFSELHLMQQCGQPPQDIVDELAPGLNFDGGLPKMPGADSSACCIQ